jgi:hypothetical protein
VLVPTPRATIRWNTTVPALEPPIRSPGTLAMNRKNSAICILLQKRS